MNSTELLRYRQKKQGQFKIVTWVIIEKTATDSPITVSKERKHMDVYTNKWRITVSLILMNKRLGICK